MQTEATPAAQTLEAMLLAMRAGLEEPGIVPLRREPTDDVSSLRRIALVALGGGADDSGGAGGETDGRLRHACAGVLAYRLRIAAETNGTPAPLSTLAAHALFAQLEREWPPGELSAALAAAEPRSGKGGRGGECRAQGGAAASAGTVAPATTTAEAAHDRLLEGRPGLLGQLSGAAVSVVVCT